MNLQAQRDISCKLNVFEHTTISGNVAFVDQQASKMKALFLLTAYRYV